MVEQTPLKRKVTGSSPVWPTCFSKKCVSISPGLESPQQNIYNSVLRGAGCEKMSGERILFATESCMAHLLF